MAKLDLNRIERCCMPAPDVRRRYIGEQCVLTKRHKSEHRSLGCGHDAPDSQP